LGTKNWNSTAVILETERLVLAPVSLADSPDVYPILGDPEVMAHWDIAEIEDPDLVDQMLTAQARAVSDETGYFWSIRRVSDSELLGLCDLSDIDRRHHRAEVGFILGKRNWRQGIQRLWARTHIGNESSERLLVKLGFELEGYLRGHVDRDGERRDCRLWGLLL
jgi:RimJ/RimL family protein N-acetyltransferase